MGPLGLLLSSQTSVFVLLPKYSMDEPVNSENGSSVATETAPSGIVAA
jgi:hypothetical protein